LALASHKVDAFVTVETTANNFIAQYPEHSYVISTVRSISEGVAIAVARDCPNEFREIEEVLDAMIQDETIAKLQKKWGFI
jgi:ABC-type amino acid transport substrate-binding protein